MKKIFTYIFLYLLFSSAAYSYCSAPSAPSTIFSPTKPTKPSVPYCANEYARTHTCDEWTISNYNNEIQSYNSAIQSYKYEVDSYIRSLQVYVDEARQYAECEIRNLD
tara:strand:- start:597 stop:920 length:324 start_codon:yes stop_codon:yes gene_type:complete